MKQQLQRLIARGFPKAKRAHEQAAAHPPFTVTGKFNLGDLFKPKTSGGSSQSRGRGASPSERHERSGSNKSARAWRRPRQGLG